MTSANVSRCSPWLAMLVGLLAVNCGGEDSGGAVQAGGAAGAGQGGAVAGAAGSGQGGAVGGAAGSGQGGAVGGAAGAGQGGAVGGAAGAGQGGAAGGGTGGCPAGVIGHCSQAAYPAVTGYTLKLVEDFDAPLDLVTDANWTYSDGFGDNRYTRYVKQAITFTGGNAVITATNDGVTNTGYPTFAEGEQAAFPAVVTGTTTVKSGELRSKYHNWRYGRFEARMKTPKNSNVIGAFFTFRNPKWLEWRELDVEITPANPSNAAGTNIIWGHLAAAYGATSNSYSAKTVTTLAGGATIYDDFHVYVLENTPTKATWYVDGTVIRTETGTGVKLPDLSMKMMFNLWVFPSGGWGGTGGPGANTYPMSMLIDWIRLYKQDTDAVYPCSPLPSCQPAADKPYQKNNAEDGLPTAAPW